MASNFQDNDRHNGHDVQNRPATDSTSRFDLPADSKEAKPDPLGDFRASLQNLGDALFEFGQARADGIRIGARSTLLKLGLAVLGGIAAGVFLIVAMVLLLVGLAGGVSRLFNTGPWLGYLIVGLVCVGVPATVIFVKARSLKKQWLENVRNKYAGKSEISKE